MRAALVLALLLAAPLAGCIDANDLALGSREVPAAPVAYDTSRGWSVPISPALYDVLEPVKELVPSVDGTPIAIAVFLPDTPVDVKLPVVIDAGPYYGPNVDRDKMRPPIVEWLVPRGYAVVQMSLRGTGESGGCLEYKSPKDVEDASAVIDWLVEQPWSNGNAGMMGRSYDGTSAWAGAASGNPHLKTIVPISGAVDGPLLYYKNGTSETRGLVNGVIYYPPYGLGTGDGGSPTWRSDKWQEQLCREALVDVHAESGYSAASGDASSQYWQDRNLRPRILENYEGSVWVVHGIEDWNVNPSQAVPFINEMQDAGIEVKAWLGRWAHHYPDRVDEHRNVRWDWAEETVRWFDHYLKDEGQKPRLGVEVEDTLFVWRHEESYPPRDAAFHEWALAAGGALDASGGGAAGASTVAREAARAVFTSEPVEAAVRVAGLPQLHVTATPTTPTGAHLFAELYDVYPDGRQVRVGWGAINLRFHDGGNTEPKALTPGTPVLATMEFEPVDALVAKGHRFRLVVHSDGVEDIMASPSAEPTVLALGDGKSLLRLPVVERGTDLSSYVPVELPGA